MKWRHRGRNSCKILECDSNMGFSLPISKIIEDFFVKCSRDRNGSVEPMIKWQCIEPLYSIHRHTQATMLKMSFCLLLLFSSLERDIMYNSNNNNDNARLWMCLLVNVFILYYIICSRVELCVCVCVSCILSRLFSLFFLHFLISFRSIFSSLLSYSSSMLVLFYILLPILFYFSFAHSLALPLLLSHSLSCFIFFWPFLPFISNNSSLPLFCHSRN